MRNIAIAAAAVIAAVLSIVSTAGAAKRDPACSASPSSVSSGDGYTVSAHGLPGGSVNLIVTTPDGTKLTSPIDPSNGSYSSYYEAPSWGAETGTYIYVFVGKVTWPAGTYNQLYATCSAQVS